MYQKKSLILVYKQPLFEQKNCVRIVYTGQREGTGEGEIRMNDKFFDLKSEKQDRMINAALKVFAQNGYKHASTDEIVKEAEISKGLLFHYFGSKMGLYCFLLDYSVKYMTFEFSRTIGEESDYFSFLEKYEMAKLNVLRNYPYMNEFIEGCLNESREDMDETGSAALISYNEMLDKYKSKLAQPNLKEGVDRKAFENIIDYTIKGLTVANMGSESFKPEKLNKEIIEYLNVFKILAAK